MLRDAERGMLYVDVCIQWYENITEKDFSLQILVIPSLPGLHYTLASASHKKYIGYFSFLFLSPIIFLFMLTFSLMPLSMVINCMADCSWMHVGQGAQPLIAGSPLNCPRDLSWITSCANS